MQGRHRRSVGWAAALALALQAGSAPARAGGAAADGPAPGVVLPHPCYENTLGLHFSGAAGGPPAGAFPRRLYLTVDDSSGRVRTPTPYFPRWYTYVGTHRYPDGVRRIVEGSGDLRTAAWYSSGQTARGGNLPAYEYKYWSCISRYNAAFWEGTTAIFAERKPDLTPFGPGAVITGAAEVSHAGNKSSFCDFSPFMQQEFRDWCTWRGLYDAKTGRYPGRPGGEVFARDPSPAQARGRHTSFNATYGTDFTTWSLRYWDPKQFPDPLPFDADPMPKAGRKGHIPGGFDAPRVPGDGPFARAWQWPDQEAPGFLEWTVARCVDEVLALIEQECGVDRTRVVSHQWAVLGNAAHLWESGKQQWQQGYRARPHWTAVTRHARTGLSGTVSVRDLDLWHDLRRLTTEWTQSEFYMFSDDRDQHAREEFIDIVSLLLRDPVHQTNGIWDGVGNAKYGTTMGAGEDALYWLFDHYPDRPFYLDHTPDYVPPPVRHPRRNGLRFGWDAAIWADRPFTWQDWRGWKEFQIGWRSGQAVTTEGATTGLGMQLTAQPGGPGEWVVRAVSTAGRAGPWTAVVEAAAAPASEWPTPAPAERMRRALTAAGDAVAAGASAAARREAARRWSLEIGAGSDTLRAALADPRTDPLVRIALCGALDRTGLGTTDGTPTAAVVARTLSKILSDSTDDVRVRRDAAGTLGRIGATDHADLLAGVLANAKDDARVRTYAARALAMLDAKHKALAPGVAQLLQWGFAEKSTSEAEQVIHVCCEMVAAHQLDGCAGVLVPALQTDTNQWKVARRSQAAMALGGLARGGNKAAAGALLGMAKRPAEKIPDPFLRGRCIGQAATLKAGAALALKIAKDEREHPVARWEAARGLRLEGKPSGAALSWFAKVLADADAAVGLRFEAARALATHGDGTAVPLLRAGLLDAAAWPELRELCARSLGDLAERGVEPKACGHALLALFGVVNDRGMRWWAADALNRITGLGLPVGEGEQLTAALAEFTARLQ